MDETTLRLFPPLRAAWALRGHQAIVPITGNNAKRVLYGALNPCTGHRVTACLRTMGQVDFQPFLSELRRRHPGRHIFLLLDHASSHTARKTLQLAKKLDIEFAYLPKKAAEYNALDHLWRGLKQEVSANWQYPTIDAHAEAAEAWVHKLTPREALTKAGVLSPKFWLRSVLQNLWRPT
jgi:transposase